MKTIKILFALLPLFFIFPSCSSNDDEQTDNNSQLISQLLGKWRLDGVTINHGDFEPIPADQDIIYEFKTGGIITITGDFFDDFDDDDDDDDIVYSGTYTVINNILNIRIDGETLPHTITQISNTSLRLAARFDADDDEGLEDVILHFTKMAN